VLPLLPVIYGIAEDVFVFQQVNAPAHRTHDTVELLCRETLHSLITIYGEPTVLDQNPVYYRILGVMQQRVYQLSRMWAWMSCISDLLRDG